MSGTLTELLFTSLVISPVDTVELCPLDVDPLPQRLTPLPASLDAEPSDADPPLGRPSPPVNRQTGVKTIPCPDFVCGR